jgi:hypothetical protein
VHVHSGTKWGIHAFFVYKEKNKREIHVKSSFHLDQLEAGSKLKKTYHTEDIFIISSSFQKEAVSIVCQFAIGCFLGVRRHYVLYLDKDTYRVSRYLSVPVFADRRLGAKLYAIAAEFIRFSVFTRFNNLWSIGLPSPVFQLKGKI